MYILIVVHSFQNSKAWREVVAVFPLRQSSSVLQLSAMTSAYAEVNDLSSFHFLQAVPGNCTAMHGVAQLSQEKGCSDADDTFIITDNGEDNQGTVDQPGYKGI